MILMLYFSLAFAQSINLEQAFKNEMTSLLNQQSFLTESLLTSKKKYLLEKKKVENEILELEKRMTEISLKNETLTEKLKLNGQNNKQIQQKKQSLLSTFKKAKEILDKTKRDLELSTLKTIQDPIPEVIEVSGYQDIAHQSLELLVKSNRIEPVLASYYSKEGELTNGEMIRYGRIAATIRNDQLAPSGKGLLQQVSLASLNPKMIDLVIFDNLTSTSSLKKTAHFWDFFADQIPLVVLSLLMLLVLGLFSLFAQE